MEFPAQATLKAAVLVKAIRELATKALETAREKEKGTETALV